MERPHVATGSIQDRGPRLVHKRNVATRRILRVWAFIQIGDGRGRQIDASCTTAPRATLTENRGTSNGAKSGGARRNRNGSATMFLISKRIRRSEEHTSELQLQSNLVCRLL